MKSFFAPILSLAVFFSIRSFVYANGGISTTSSVDGSTATVLFTYYDSGCGVDITITPVEASGPNGSTPGEATPTAYEDLTGTLQDESYQGAVTFTSLTEGQYTVAISQSCTESTNEETITVSAINAGGGRVSSIQVSSIEDTSPETDSGATSSGTTVIEEILNDTGTVTNEPEDTITICDEYEYIHERFEKLTAEEKYIVYNVPEEYQTFFEEKLQEVTTKIIRGLRQIHDTEKRNQAINAIVCLIEGKKAERALKYADVGYRTSTHNRDDYMIQYVEDMVILEFTPQ